MKLLVSLKPGLLCFLSNSKACRAGESSASFAHLRSQLYFVFFRHFSSSLPCLRPWLIHLYSYTPLPANPTSESLSLGNHLHADNAVCTKMFISLTYKSEKLEMTYMSNRGLAETTVHASLQWNSNAVLPN